MEEDKVFSMAKWQIQPGQEAVVNQALAQLTEQSRAEPGCLYYQPHVSASQPDLLYLYEVYASPAAAAAHQQSAHYKQLALETIVPLISLREVVKVTPLFGVLNSRF